VALKEHIDCQSNNSSISDERLKNIGMNKREIKEFWSKLKVPEVPDFSLDMSTAKPPSYFEECAKKFVPEVRK
jgi:hypothetical protein